MKHTKKPKRCLALLVLLAATACVIAGTFGGGRFYLASNLSFLTNSTQTATSSMPVSVPQNALLIIQVSATGVAGSTGTSNVVVGFNLWDGDPAHPYSTIEPISASVNCDGTNTAVGWTVVNPINLSGAQWIRADQVATTQPAGVTVSATYTFFQQ